MVRRIKILYINYDSNEFSGVAVLLRNIYRHIDHSKMQIDFLTPNTSSYKTNKEEIEGEGGNIFEFHINCKSRKGKLLFGRRLKIFLKEHTYDIIHINSSKVFFDCIAAIEAKLAGAKVIVHSHNAIGRKWWEIPFAFFVKSIMQKEADVLCACSKNAALYTFTFQKVKNGDVIIIKNGIDLQKFQYKEDMRKRVRQELNLNGHFTVGHIGRFSEQKNHTFLIDVFMEILKKKPTAILLMVGQGELETEIRKKVKDLHIENNVIFLGASNNVEDLYQAMDVFLFPSLFEGLPISLIEAQTNGLPCVISDTITTEVDLTSLIQRMSLQNSPQEWADKVLSIDTDVDKRGLYKKEMEEAGYDIKDTASQVSAIYEELISK